MKKSLLLVLSLLLVTLALSGQNDKKQDEFLFKNDSSNIKLRTTTPQRTITLGKHSSEPLILINGQVSSIGLKGVDPNFIESITVLKDPQVTNIYGDEGSKGVILVKTNDKLNLNHRQPGPISNFSFEPLVIVNGERSSIGLNFINPKEIKSITVLKDQQSTLSYGESGRNGVILVTTKTIIKPGK